MDPRREAVYINGAFFLNQLREEMGDENFFEFLSTYQETYRFQIATPEEYFNLAEEAAGEDLDALLMNWFDRASSSQ